uniref:Uncharacterized protein n=1 Tax=Eptatretus burgeri TaxID=7764 RepID=A0A8C4QJT5_EPTBU
METWQQLSVPPLSAAGRKVLTIMHRMQAQEEQIGPTQLKKPKITRPRDPFLSGPAEFSTIVPTVFTPHETVEYINMDHISDESFHWTPNNPIPIIADELEEPLTMNPIYKIPAQLKPYKAKALPHFGSPCCSFRGPTNFVVTTKTEFPFSKSMDHRTSTPTNPTTSKLINLANAKPQGSFEKRSCQIINDVRGGQPSKPLINSTNSIPQGGVEERPRQIIKDVRGGQPSKPLINSTNSRPQGLVDERPCEIIKDARIGQPSRPLSDVICDLEYQSVFTLLPSERLVLLSTIEKAEFVGLTLVEREPGYKIFNQGNSLKFSGVMLLIQMKFTSTTTTPQPGFYFLPFPNPSKEDKTNGVDLEFVKLVLLKTLRHNGCVSCFRAQELMRTILLCPQLSFTWRDAQGWEVMDPEVASWLLDPNLHAASPKTLLNIHLQQVLPDLKKLSQTKRSCTVLSFLPQLSNVLLDKLKKENQWIVFREMEMKLTPVLAAMETYQFNLDTECLNNSSQALSLNLHKLEREAHQAAGEPFLLTSNAQLREILFNKLKLKERCPNKKLQKTGITKQQSTSEAVLLQLQNLHPLPGIILQYRQVGPPLFNTYTQSINHLLI